MVDNSQLKKEMIMQKFTFRVDVLSDAGVDVESIRSSLLGAVDGVGQYAAATATGSESLTDQGLKVFAKRVLGISLATPKTKASKAPKAEAVEA